MVDKSIHSLKKGKSSRNETTSYNYIYLSYYIGVIWPCPQAKKQAFTPETYMSFVGIQHIVNLTSFVSAHYYGSLFGKW